MKTILSLPLTLWICIAFIPSVLAQSSEASKTFKNHLNDVVQQVEQEENADDKRALLNQSFDKMINAFEKIENMNRFSDEELSAIAQLRENIRDKKNELNGLEGYRRVSDLELDEFANYAQDDFEQADRTLTIGLTTALLIVIILLLL